MKRTLSLLLAVFLLAGCSGSGGEVDGMLAFREKLLKAQSVSFDADITADYGTEVHTFSMKCSQEQSGELRFSVTKPETISGISGSIKETVGELTFDDKVLAFPLLADGLITPVCAPWLLCQAMGSGYVSSCGNDGDMVRVCIDDSFQGETLQVDLWLNKDSIPVRGEILWKGRRIMSVDVHNFNFL